MKGEDAGTFKLEGGILIGEYSESIAATSYYLHAFFHAAEQGTRVHGLKRETNVVQRYL